MANYLINTSTHEVHDSASTKGCLPALVKQLALGSHATCSGAVLSARSQGYVKANGCFYCANACHISAG